MRIKKVTLRRRLRGDFFAVWGRHGGGGEGRGAAPAAPPQGGGGKRAAGTLRRRSRRAAPRFPHPAAGRPKKTAPDNGCRGELLCRDQSVMGVKTLSLLVSATMSER